MKKSILAGLIAAVLSLAACSSGGQAAPSVQTEPPRQTVEPSVTPVREPLHVVATTYPVYLLATAVTQGTEGVEVTLMLNQGTSCLHDYNLTATDMKAIEKADAIIMSGAGLEAFMTDALARSSAAVIDSSAGVGLLLYDSDHEHDHDHEDDDGHDHDGEDDPHIWMDPAKAAQMLENIRAALTELDGENTAIYQANADAAQAELTAALERWRGMLAPLNRRDIITFHDGFQYFARVFDLNLLFAIEEEEGAEASAKEIKEIAGLINAGKANGSIPGVFTEENGSDATANAIARETGVQPHQLSMIMSGEGIGLEEYIRVMEFNITVLVEALS